MKDDLVTSKRPTFDSLKAELDSLIPVFPNWPTPGVLFRDIMPIFQRPDLVKNLTLAIADHCRSLPVSVDAVAGLEARGFLFGPLLAVELGVPFVPIRKHGKLPGEVLHYSYLKEYGKDIVEIQKNAIKPGAKVFVVDDLLATGGTMTSGIELIKSAGGQIAEAFCLIELEGLKGRAALPQDVPFFSVIKY